MNAFEDELIENVKKYPILYRSKHNNYKNIMCKDSCWAEIATALKISPDECKAKWRNIRDSYNKNVKRKSKSGASKAISKYDDAKLDFLAERYGLREPLNIEFSASSNNSFEDEEKHDYDPFNEEFSEPSVPDSQPILQNTSDIAHPVQQTPYSPSFINSSLNHTEEEIKPRKKAMKRKNDSVIEEVENEDEKSIILQEIVEVPPRREGSPTHNFFSSMADIVCKFPAEKIAETRMRICTLVSEVEVQVLRDKSHSNLRR